MVCKLQTIWTFACISWLILWVISAVQLQLHAVLIDSALGFWQEIFVTFQPSESKTSVRILILERYSMKNPNSKVHGFRIIELIVLLLCPSPMTYDKTMNLIVQNPWTLDFRFFTKYRSCLDMNHTRWKKINYWIIKISFFSTFELGSDKPLS